MHPVLLQIGPLTIYSYGVLVAAGVLLGLWYARRQAPHAGLNRDEVWNLGIYMVLTALVVAKLWLVVIDWSYFAAHPREIFSFGVVQSGGTFFGGVIGGDFARGGLHVVREDAYLAAAGYICRGASSWPCHRAARMFHGGLLLWQADLAALGNKIHESDCRAASRHADWRGSASHAALRSRGGDCQFRFSHLAREAAAIRGADCRHLSSSVRH